MKSRTNAICECCAQAHDGINGRYCERLKCYVEYEKAPLCAGSNLKPSAEITSRYLHELQNCYFAVEGEELNIKP